MFVGRCSNARFDFGRAERPRRRCKLYDEKANTSSGDVTCRGNLDVLRSMRNSAVTDELK